MMMIVQDKKGRNTNWVSKNKTRRDKPFCQANSIIIHPERRRLNKKKEEGERSKEGLNKED